MRRLLATLMLIFALSLPSFGGHHQVGGRWCKCDAVQGACSCCGSLVGVTSNQENESTSLHASDEAQPKLEIDIIRMAFLMWLKVKA